MKLPTSWRAAFLNTLLYAAVAVIFSCQAASQEASQILVLPSNPDRAPLKSFLSKKDTAEWAKAVKPLKHSVKWSLIPNENCKLATLKHCKTPPAFFFIAQMKSLFSVDDYPTYRIVNRLNVDLPSANLERWHLWSDTISPPKSFPKEGAWKDFEKNKNKINEDWKQHESDTFEYVAIWYADTKPMTYKSIVLLGVILKDEVNLSSCATKMQHDKIDYLSRHHIQENASTLSVYALSYQQPANDSPDKESSNQVLRYTHQTPVGSRTSNLGKLQPNDGSQQYFVKPSVSLMKNPKNVKKPEIQENELRDLLDDWIILYSTFIKHLDRYLKFHVDNGTVDTVNALIEYARDAEASKHVDGLQINKILSLLPVTNVADRKGEPQYSEILKPFYTMLVDIVCGYFEKYLPQHSWLKIQDNTSVYIRKYREDPRYFNPFKARDGLNNLWNLCIDDDLHLDELKLLIRYTAITEDGYKHLLTLIDNKSTEAREMSPSFKSTHHRSEK